MSTQLLSMSFLIHTVGFTLCMLVSLYYLLRFTLRIMPMFSFFSGTSFFFLSGCFLMKTFPPFDISNITVFMSVPPLLRYIFIAGTAVSLCLCAFTQRRTQTVDISFYIFKLFAITECFLLFSYPHFTSRIFDICFITSICFYLLMQILKNDALVPKEEAIAEQLKYRLNKVYESKTGYLSTQLRPEMIHNTLLTVSEVCTYDPELADQLLVALSKYLRQPLDFNTRNAIIPLKEELDLTDAYVTLMTYQNPDIKVTFTTDDTDNDIVVPILTLQPLVENAFQYAFSPEKCEHNSRVNKRLQKEGKQITISAVRNDNSVFVSVKDNGIGCKSKSIYSHMLSPASCLNIGLYKVNKRLMDSLGHGITIQSKKNNGTQVSFYLQCPDKKEGKQ